MKKDTVMATVFTLIGIVVGATVNNYLASQREVSRDLFDARLTAYAAFMDGQALLAKGQSDEETKKANLQITKSKYELAMLSTEETLAAMVGYWRQHPQHAFDPCPDQALRTLDAGMYQQIRKEMMPPGESAIDVRILVPFMWNCRILDK